MPLSELLAGHQQFKSYFSENKDRLLKLAQEHQPRVLWIGCSDSRVSPEQILNAQPGDLFVFRNVANIIPPNGTANDTVGAVIEYAVLHLRVSDIVVCGHGDCGGIKALGHDISMMREPHLARWIEFARPALGQIQASGIAEEKHHLETIKANVLLQRKNLLTYDCVRDAVQAGKLRVHAWLYDVWTGDLSRYDDKSGQWCALDQDPKGFH